MPHGNTVIDGNGIELGGKTAHLLNLSLDNLTNFMQMRMPRHKLGERVDDSDDRLAKLFLFHTCGHP